MANARPGLLYVKDIPADAKLFEAMVAADLQIEGGGAKRRDRTYQQPGVRSPDWAKIKRRGCLEGREVRG